MPFYNPNIPQPNDILSDSQDEILQNFQQINTVFGINHATFETANQGKHDKVEFPLQAVAPVAVGQDWLIYNKVPAAPYPATGEQELWISNTGKFLLPITALGVGGDGWSYTPSGLLIKWGNANPVVGFNQVILYPDDGGVTIPEFGVVFSVTVSAGSTTGNPRGVTLVNGSLTASITVDVWNAVNGAAATADVTYFSIGFPAVS